MPARRLAGTTEHRCFPNTGASDGNGRRAGGWVKCLSPGHFIESSKACFPSRFLPSRSHLPTAAEFQAKAGRMHQGQLVFLGPAMGN